MRSRLGLWQNINHLAMLRLSCCGSEQPKAQDTRYTPRTKQFSVLIGYE